MTTVSLKGYWLETNYRGRPAKTLLVCGVEIGCVAPNRPEDGPGFAGWAWPRYGGADLDLHALERRGFASEAAAMEWVKETVENAPPPKAYKKLVAA